MIERKFGCVRLSSAAAMLVFLWASSSAFADPLAKVLLAESNIVRAEFSVEQILVQASQPLTALGAGNGVPAGFESNAPEAASRASVWPVPSLLVLLAIILAGLNARRGRRTSDLVLGIRA